VYCWDRKLLYEARVVRREGNKYKVHFVGYKKAHDKWYTTDDMMGKDPKSTRIQRVIDTFVKCGKGSKMTN